MKRQQGSDVTRDQVLDTVARWQDAFARRDMTVLAELYADSAVMESPLAGSVTGRDAVIKTTLSLLSAFPDAQFDSETPLVDGDRVAIVSSASGTHVGTFLGIPPTQRHFKFSLVFLLDLRDGHIVHDRRIYDFTGFLVQLGVLKAKPAH